MRTLAVILFALVGIAAASGCGDSSSNQSEPTAAGTTTATTPTTTTEGIDPLEGAGKTTVVGLFLVVRMEPASGFDLNTGEGELVYKGPRRIEGSSAGTSVVNELVRTGDFEAVLTWAIGLEEKVDFRVTTADSPSRLIVDFRNH
jgi:hypothetical protein